MTNIKITEKMGRTGKTYFNVDCSKHRIETSLYTEIVKKLTSKYFGVGCRGGFNCWSEAGLDLVKQMLGLIETVVPVEATTETISKVTETYSLTNILENPILDEDQRLFLNFVYQLTQELGEEDFRNQFFTLIANPGSGKTFVSEELVKLLTLVFPNWKIGYFTFAVKPAKEFQEKLDKYGLENIKISTLDSLFYQTLKTKYKKLSCVKQESLSFENLLDFSASYDKNEAKTKYVLANNGMYTGKNNYIHPAVVKVFNQVLGFLKAWNISDNDINLLEIIEKIIIEKNINIRFITTRTLQELISDIAFVLKESNKFHLVVNQWGSYSHYFDRRDYSYIITQEGEFIFKTFDFIVVDEAQDMNTSQYMALDLVRNFNNANICLIGDPKQAIYTDLNGSEDGRSLIGLSEKQGTHKFKLRYNHRSSAAVNAAWARYYNLLLDIDYKYSSKTVGEVKSISQSEVYSSIKSGDAILTYTNKDVFNMIVESLSNGFNIQLNSSNFVKDFLPLTEPVKGDKTKSISCILDFYQKQIDKANTELIEDEEDSNSIYLAKYYEKLLNKVEKLITSFEADVEESIENFINKIKTRIGTEGNKGLITIGTFHSCKGQTVKGDVYLHNLSKSLDKLNEKAKQNLGLVVESRAVYNNYYFETED